MWGIACARGSTDNMDTAGKKDYTDLNKMGEVWCMNGSIFYENDRGRWAVSWRYAGKACLIRRYKGEYMYDRSIAEKCRALIQSRWEDHLNGNCQFRIEEFTARGWTDVIEFYSEWLETVIKPQKKPATYKCYKSYMVNWLEPFFTQNPVRLHEIQLNTLNKLLNFIKLSGKGKLNVIMALRSCMDYAWRSRRIREVPPFPSRKDYGLVEPEWSWLREDKQIELINAIPEIYRPPFLWLKYHYRRPGEACVLYKTDYDAINNAFWIRRTISARTLVDTTKTGVAHYAPCHSKFKPIARQLLGTNPWSPYLFVNPRSRRKEQGGRYTLESLGNQR